MPTQKNEIPMTSAQDIVKKQYQPPQFNSYGRITELTAGGSLFMNEMGMGTFMFRMP